MSIRILIRIEHIKIQDISMESIYVVIKNDWGLRAVGKTARKGRRVRGLGADAGEAGQLI